MRENSNRSPDKSVNDVIAVLKELFSEELHHRLFLVGGTIRDHVMGKPGSDVDLVTDLSAQHLELLGFHHVHGKSTDPIFFKSHPQFGKLEITILKPGQSLEDNLLLRDFRCNALAMRLDGTIIDPLCGQNDIENRVVVPCSPRSLDEDPIRIFRALCLESHGWRLSPELIREVHEYPWEKRLTDIPIERFTRELMKAMAGERPYSFFERMIEHGVGRCYLPEIFDMQHVPAGPSKYHNNDTVFSHSLDALRRMTLLTDDPAARLAAFFHDLGKLTTPREMLPSHIGHDKAGEPFSRTVCSRLKLSAPWSRLIAATSALHLVAGRWQELRPVTKLKLARRSHKCGISAWLPLLVSADRNTGNPMPGWNMACQAAVMTAAKMGLTGEIIEKTALTERKRLIEKLQMECYLTMLANKGAVD